jgi:hypothetical protein
MSPFEYFPAAIVPEGDVFMVDNFEDGNLENVYGTWELIVNFHGDTAPISITPAAAAGYGNNSLYFSIISPFDFSLDTGFEVNKQGAFKVYYDVRNFKYLKFSASMTTTAQPSAIRCVVWIDGNADLVGQAYDGGFSPEFTEYTIELASLGGSDAGLRNKVYSGTNSVRIGFNVPYREKVDFIIDNIRFEK